MGKTTVTPQREPRRGLTFDDVWAALMETRERQEEMARIFKKNAKEAEQRQKEIDRILKENAKEAERRQQETDRIIKERQQETDRQMKEADRQLKEQMRETDRRMDERIGFLSNRFGELAEHLVAPGIHARFNELGYFFGEVAPGGCKIIGTDGKTKTEIDLLLQNDETVMAVEVKVKPMIKDVEHHIKRLEILRDHRRKKNDNRKIQGAIAGAVFGIAEKKAVIEAGLYVIEQSGDTMKIDIPDGFVPREW